MPTKYDQEIAARLRLRAGQVGATIELLDSGNTLPFIARYRKEVTGGLDEEQIRQLLETVTRLRSVDERRETILESIQNQGLLTPELRDQIETADTLTRLEDLYQPYKPKRRTRASIARDHGLQPLADMILEQVRASGTADQLAAPFVSEAVPTTADALAGARDIAAETISDSAEVRGQTRLKAMRFGLLRSLRIKDAKDERAVYQLYYEFEGRVDRIKPYQVLAINRGEAAGILRVHVDVAERDWRQAVEMIFRADHRSPMAEQLELAIEDAARRLLLPAIERDTRAALTDEAENHAITVFATNLRSLLNQPPLAGQTVLGIDPGFRTGCKAAVVDETGRVLETAAIFPHEPQRRWNDALQTLAGLVEQYGVTLIAIGNGTASRETEQLTAELTRARSDLRYLIVSEAGASVYSASPLARAELPDLDVTLRGAVSIARRALDPLAELVKIEPKAIGVGMYQHDVNQKRLAEALEGVVETVVNRVGVDANTASPALLAHVAGIGQRLAERIVAYRDENGVFDSRRALRQVPGLGPKAYEQAAGFLRIRGGNEPLDASAIHPESYAVAEAVLKRAGLRKNSSPVERQAALDDLRGRVSPEALAAELGTGLPTLADILSQLIRPGRDPRADLPAPILRSDVLSMDDLAAGMQLNGTVRNVVDFGAFVDIGVKQDGLLHRSQIPPGYMLSLGDIIRVEILNVEKERGRISLGWTEG